MKLHSQQPKTQPGSASRYFGLIFGIAVVATIVIAGIKKQSLMDWWKLQNYTPPATISNLADETTMTAKARRLFYISHPTLEDAQTFNKNCKVKQEKTIVLGCYVGGNMQKIYIFKVSEARLNGVEEVTAAHETLHAAYDRMSSSQKTHVNAMLKTEMTNLKSNDHLQELIQVYNKQEPGQLYNEMHSILGTEYGNLDPALEQYYSQYFTNRKTIVGYANGYKKVFNQMQAQLNQDEQLLRDLKSQIDTLSSDIKLQKVKLDAKTDQMDRLRDDYPDEYNNQVAGYNQQVNRYNQTVGRYKNLIVQYNNLVKAHNQIAIDYNSLNNELNSKYKPIDQQN